MSVEKSEIRAAMAHDLGVRFDDALDAAEREALRSEGGAEWLTRTSLLVAAAHKALDAEVEAGKMDLDAASAAKAVVSRLASQLVSLTASAAGEAQAARGKAAGLRMAVAVTKQAFDVARAQASADPEAPADGGRLAGQRPAPGLKSRRQLTDEAVRAATPPVGGKRRGKETARAAHT